jgi:uncharacterized membrane protein YdjX (TVP38/TMEM64 family)
MPTMPKPILQPAGYRRRRDVARLLVVGIVASILTTAWKLGLLNQLGEPAKLGRALVNLGGWGYAAYVLAFTLLQPFGVPGTVFIVAAALIWPWPIAFLLSMLGSLFASTAGFNFARFVARDWASPRIPARFRKYNDALELRAFWTIFWLRLVFWMQPMLHLFFGLSKVRGTTHFWASAAGYVLPLFVVSYFGQRVFDALRLLPLRTWVKLAITVAIVAIGGICIRALRRRARGNTRSE